jgi:ABC-type multidrug transport system fused ATPase/permease subunit
MVISSIHHVQGLTNGVLMPLLQVASAAIIGIFIVGALVAIDPLVAFLSFAGFGMIYVAVSLVVRRRLRANARIVVEAQRESVRTVQEGLGGIRDIIIDGTRPAFVARFAEVQAALWRAQQANALAAAVPRFAIEAAGMALIAGVAAMVASANADIGRVLPVIGVFALGAQRLLPLLQLVYGNWALAISNLSAVRVVLDLLDAPVERDESTAPAEPLPFEREIAFREVSFRYSSDRPAVLDGTSFSVARGSRVMIVGQTGAGKSTIVDLLMGLLEPTGGTIEIDGRRLDERTRFGWRQQIAHVPQSIFLADASIAANIAFGVPSARIDLARVREAARRACIDGFVATLPMGYDTVVGERGVNLSGGQRQRIGLARALYKRASVLILDEATNALDPETEIAVFESICALSGITVVIVAHRLTPQRFCDQILEVLPGRAISRAPDAGVTSSERRSSRGGGDAMELADDGSGRSEHGALGLAPPR